MEFNIVSIKTDGYISCQSSFYTVLDMFESKNYIFRKGTNVLRGEIDSGNFGISYLIAMFNKVDKKTLFLPPVAEVDGEIMHLSELTKYACYMDTLYPLFSSRKTAREMISRGLRKSSLPYTADEIFEMFCVQDFRRDRPIKATGNEKIKIMAAVGYSYGKEIFCFPWLSRLRFESYNKHMPFTLEKLSSLGKIVILPLASN